MSRSALAFHLTPDPQLGERAAVSITSPAPSVEVPAGPSLLSSTPDGPRLLPLDRREPDDGAYVLEPMRGQQRPLLTLLAPRGAGAVRVNGLPAPTVALLEPGDQVQLRGDVVLHVSLFRRPFVGAAGETHRDKTCPVCRTRVAEADVVYECANCATVLHLESRPPDGQDPLECALVGTTCPSCGWEIDLTEGFSHHPEL